MNLRYRELAWQYWLAMSVLLTVWLCGYPLALRAAWILSLVQVAHFAWKSRGVTHFSVQVRLAYAALLWLGMFPYLGVVHWFMAIGAWANVLFDYCFLARVMSLAPWNRKEPLTAWLAMRAFAITRHTAEAASRTALPPERACSLHNQITKAAA